MDSLLGSIRRVADEFSILDTLSPSTLAEQLETVKEELAEFEVWLGCPPAGATDAAIQDQLAVWDQARQWLFAYERALSQREIAALDEELAEVRLLMRALENDSYHSHDEMAAADAYWDELDQRETRILRRLDELRAPVPTAEDEPRSHIQRALDQQWASANFAGPGCAFCDSILGGCRCWEERREAHEAEERRGVRAERAEIAARIARGECACEELPEGEICEVCEREEALRCRECGSCPCRPECCGGCGGCTRCRGDPCKGCGGWESDCHCYEDDGEDYDPSDPYGDGAPEEHEGHPGYDDGCW